MSEPNEFVWIARQGDESQIVEGDKEACEERVALANFGRDMARMYGDRNNIPEAYAEQVPVTPDLTFTIKMPIRRAR